MRGIRIRKIVMGAVAAIVMAVVALPVFALTPQMGMGGVPTAQAPMTEKEVIQLVKHNKKDLAKIAPELQSRGLAFEMTPEIEGKLRKAGATDELMTSLQKLTPSARAAAAKAKGMELASEEERNAYAAVVRSVEKPDEMIPLATSFEQKYPKSQWLPYVYALEADAYQQKGDDPRALHYAQKSLKLVPDNLMSLTIAATYLPSPEMVNNLTDAQKTKNLDEAEADANKVLEIISNAPKKPNETDADYQKRKDEAGSYAYSALGMIHLQRAEMGLTPDAAELAKAEQAYEAAVKDSPAPYAPDYYRLGQVLEDEGKTDEAIAAFTKAAAAAATQSPQLQTMAQQEIQKLTQKKGGAGPSKTQ